MKEIIGWTRPLKRPRERWRAFGALVFILGILGILLAPAPADAQVRFIRVEGNQRLEVETVRAYMTIREGERASPSEINRSIKAMFASGLFADVSIQEEGGGLVVRVVENPIINRIAFEGNRRINDKTLLDESRLKPREVYTRARVQEVVTRFVELYRRDGRFGARVEPKIIRLEQNRVDIVFEIVEGPVTKVRSIIFVGNNHFSNFRLQQEISTVQSSILRLFSSADNYDPDRINYDKELLRRFYLRKGYADFRVVSALAELSPAGNSFFITFTVEEGERYRFLASEIKNELQDINLSRLRRQIRHREGQVYNANRIDESISRIRALLGVQGYAFADVQPEVDRDKEAKTIKVDYVIAQGPRVYIDRINITGNSRTQDRVIRRELRLDEGDAFNQLLLARSERNIRGLGFFSNVDISDYPGDQEDRVSIDIAVTEQSTGELTLGIGYSTAEMVRGDISLAERNLLGRGQEIALRGSFSQETINLNATFTEPRFFGRDLSSEWNVFYTTRNFTTEIGKSDVRGGGRSRISFPLSPDSRLSLDILMNQVSFRNTSADRDTNPPYETFHVEGGYSFFIDKRNDRIEPTGGWDFLVSQKIGGGVGQFEGDAAQNNLTTFLRSEVVLDFYYSPFENWILHARSGGGYTFNYRPGGEVLFSDRFFRGGLNFRGFERLGVGPRDIFRNTALGANAYVINTIELTIPLGLPRELGIKTALFTDFGWVGVVDDESTYRLNPATDRFEEIALGGTQPHWRGNIQDGFDFRGTYGLSIGWRSPLGPVRFDIAGIYAQNDYDRYRLFNFSIGTRI